MGGSRAPHLGTSSLGESGVNARPRVDRGAARQPHHYVTRVTSSGLASWVSSELNASINSGASKARLRRPTLICVSTPASTSRSIPWLVAWNDRPINSAAEDTVNTGAAGSAPISRRAAESRRVVPTRCRQDDCNTRTCSSNRLRIAHILEYRRACSRFAVVVLPSSPG